MYYCIYPYVYCLEKNVHLCYFIDMQKIFERMKELRLEKGKTQAQIAEETGLTISAISKWEQGSRVPNALAIITLAKYYGV